MKLGMLLCLLTVAVMVVQAQMPLQEMVKTEQAFSRMAEEKNARDAFMAFIADDGLLFRPGAVNGKKWMEEHPVPPSDKKPLLAWQPAFAGMAASGDMGFTTGPWELRNDIKDEKPSGYGHFVTVWKKQADGSWKFEVDLGISHPEPGGPQTLWRPTGETKPGKTKAVPHDETLRNLLDRDRIMATAAAEKGLSQAFLVYASPDVRLYRAASLPHIGREASIDALNKTKGQFVSQPISGDVSQAGDLGYTHGTYEVTDEARKVIERGSYVRIWQKQNGARLVVLDVTNAH
jgi:ketosteroid isomerase-like protein